MLQKKENRLKDVLVWDVQTVHSDRKMSYGVSFELVSKILGNSIEIQQKLMLKNVRMTQLYGKISIVRAKCLNT